MMKVKITRSRDVNSWYQDRIGEVFIVEPYEKDDDYWQLVEQDEKHTIKLIKKSECLTVE